MDLRSRDVNSRDFFASSSSSSRSMSRVRVRVRVQGFHRVQNEFRKALQFRKIKHLLMKIALLLCTFDHIICNDLCFGHRNYQYHGKMIKHM